MLNLFPIQFLALFAYFILRIFVGIALLIIAKRLGKVYLEIKASFAIYTYWIARSLLLGLGILFIIGMYTQIAALLTITMSVVMILFPFPALRSELLDRIVWFLLLGASLSLFITGAGVLAFDLPI